MCLAMWIQHSEIDVVDVDAVVADNVVDVVVAENYSLNSILCELEHSPNVLVLNILLILNVNSSSWSSMELSMMTRATIHVMKSHDILRSIARQNVLPVAHRYAASRSDARSSELDNVQREQWRHAASRWLDSWCVWKMKVNLLMNIMQFVLVNNKRFGLLCWIIASLFWYLRNFDWNVHGERD